MLQTEVVKTLVKMIDKIVNALYTNFPRQFQQSIRAKGKVFTLNEPRAEVSVYYYHHSHRVTENSVHFLQ